jgi:hypothetical protein
VQDGADAADVGEANARRDLEHSAERDERGDIGPPAGQVMAREAGKAPRHAGPGHRSAPGTGGLARRGEAPIRRARVTRDVKAHLDAGIRTAPARNDQRARARGVHRNETLVAGASRERPSRLDPLAQQGAAAAACRPVPAVQTIGGVARALDPLLHVPSRRLAPTRADVEIRHVSSCWVRAPTPDRSAARADMPTLGTDGRRPEVTLCANPLPVSSPSRPTQHRRLHRVRS